jgi:hypothetical protein
MRLSVHPGEFSYEFIEILREIVSAYCRVIRHDDPHLRTTRDIGSVRTQETERLMLSHGYGWRVSCASRKRDGRSRWLQRLVRPGTHVATSTRTETTHDQRCWSTHVSN